jgi:TATA-binding protein-associated factor
VQHNISQPPDKIVKNLCTFLCQDVEQTPTFAYSRTIYKGILTLQTWSKIVPGRGGKETQEKGEPAKSEDEAAKTRLSRRGAGLAFNRLSTKFGPRLLEAIPKMWQSMAGGLLSACSAGTAKLSSAVRLLSPCLEQSLPKKQTLPWKSNTVRMSSTP